jgi:sulfotransferase 6B1
MSTVNFLWLSLVRFANRQTRTKRSLRRVGIMAYASVVRINQFLPPPRVLLNGPPKSGTHLLSDCLALMPRMMFSGRHFALTEYYIPSGFRSEAQPSSLERYPSLNEEGLATFLKRCPEGMFVTAHSRFHPALDALIEELQFKHIFLLRDPRDIVISHVFHVKREPLHHQHKYFKTLDNDAERIMRTIRNFRWDVVNGVPLRSEFDTFAGLAPWLHHRSTLVIRFEDLVGPQGGGDKEKQLAIIKRIGDFVERPLSQEQASQIGQKMYGKNSLTFRKGQRGDWRNHFTDAHRCVFKEVAGDLLINLGYETDMNW